MNKLVVAGLTGLATVGVMGIYQEASACGVGDVDFQVTATSLNVRSGPGTSYPVIGSVKKGQVYKPFEAEQNGAWGKIKLSNGRTGWVAMQYMKSMDTCNIPDESTNSQVSERNWEGVVTANILNVRYNPSTKSSITAKLPKDTVVEVQYETNGWYRIEYKKNGRFDFGYVAKSYVAKKSETSSNNNTSNSQVKEENWAGVVTASSLNVRTGAGTSYSAKTSLQKGTEVEVKYEKNGWYRIEYKKNGRFDFGYVAKSYVAKKSETSSNPSYDYKIEGEVYDEETGALRWFERTVYAPASTPLNIRQHPTTNSKPITKVARYSKIFISGSHGDWYRVQGSDSNGKSYDGWAHSEYIF